MNSIQKKMRTFANVIFVIKDTQFAILFAHMFKAQWLYFFMTSPLSLVVKPVLGSALLILAALQLYQFATTRKKSPELWIMTLLGVSSVLLSNVSIWGGIIALSTGMVFTAGPVFFLAAITTGLLMHLLLTGMHVYQAFKAPKNSNERMHHMQATIQNSLVAAQFAFCVVAMVFTVFTPISPVVSAVFASLAVAMILSMIIWRIIPREHKLAIKEYFGFSKPEATLEPTQEPENSLKPVNELEQESTPLLPATSKSREGFNSPGLSFFNKKSQEEDRISEELVTGLTW